MKTCRKVISFVLAFVCMLSVMVATIPAASAATANAKVAEVKGITFQNIKTGEYLNFDFGTLKNGQPVRVYPRDGSIEQLWCIVRVSGTTYRIVTYKSSKYALDIYRGNSALKASQQADIWTAGGDTKAQNVQFYLCDDGSFIIRMAANNQLAMAATTSKGRVKLAKFDPSSSAQKWVIKDTKGNKIDIKTGTTTTPATPSDASSSAKFVKALTSKYTTNVTTQKWAAYNAGHGYHLGVDLGTSGNNTTNVVSIADGVVYRVVKASRSGGWGNFIIVKHTLPNNGKVFYSGYGHLKSMSVKEGDAVSAGTKLGVMGSTGISTGPHLHLLCFSGNFSKSGLPKGYVSKKITGDTYTVGGLTYYNPLKVISTNGAIIK